MVDGEGANIERCSKWGGGVIKETLLMMLSSLVPSRPLKVLIVHQNVIQTT